MAPEKKPVQKPVFILDASSIRSAQPKAPAHVSPEVESIRQKIADAEKMRVIEREKGPSFSLFNYHKSLESIEIPSVAVLRDGPKKRHRP